MLRDVADHPDAPDRDALGDFLLEPVSTEGTAARRAEGKRLVEHDVLEADDTDVYAEWNPEPFEPDHDDIGTVLYYLVQLFGTPPFLEYRAGEDISHRTDTTSEYLFAVKRGVTDPDGDPDDEWLITVHDWYVSLGVSLAAWRAGEIEDASMVDAAEDTGIDADRALASLALVYYVVADSVRCVFADRWY